MVFETGEHLVRKGCLNVRTHAEAKSGDLLIAETVASALSERMAHRRQTSQQIQ